MATTAEHTLSGTFQGANRWSEKYQRNNKRSGLKNLRCFPYCLDQHRVKGFCGRPVTFMLSGNAGRKNCWAWAEFRKVDDLGDIDVGTVLTREEIGMKERNRKDCNRPWYVGELDSESGNRNDEFMSFKFNNQKKGWNYGWAANKHTCNAEHCFQVYLFVEHESEKLICVGRHQSPKFKLFCRRRPALSISQSSTLSDVRSDAAPSPRFDDLHPSMRGYPSPLSSVGEGNSAQQHHASMRGERMLHRQVAPVGSHLKRPYPFMNTKQEDPYQERYGRLDHGQQWGSRTVKRECHTDSRFQQRPVPQEQLPPIVSVDPEAEKNLNARLWRLTVILDLLEARWGSEILFSNKKYAQGRDFQGSSVMFNGANDMEQPASHQSAQQRPQPPVPPIQPNPPRMDMEAAFDAEFAEVDLDTDYEFYGDLFQDDGHQEARPQSAAPTSGLFEQTIREAFGEAPPTVPTPQPEVEKLPEAPGNRTYVLDEFGRYLLLETDITDEIRRALTCYMGAPSDFVAHRLKEAFMQIMNVYLGKFLLSHGMSLKEFEDLIGESMKEKAIDPVSRRPHAVSRFRMLLNQIKPQLSEQEKSHRMSLTASSQTLIPENLDLTGKWKYDDSIMQALDVIREMQGVPWILRKMLSGMEDEVNITQVPGKVFFQHKPKMLSDGFVEYQLDGKQNPWSSSAPIPWTKPLVFTSRASFEGDHYRFEHYYSESLRSKRLFRKSFHSDTLEVIVAIQQRNPKSMVWEDQFSTRGLAYRV